MHVKADIVFMLDSSSSEGAANFQKQKDFVVSFVNALTIGPSNVQIGVIDFSTTATVNFKLNDHRTKATVVSAINRISYVQGSTHTDLGLNLAWTKVFNQVGDRPDAQNILYVLTDGQSSSPAATVLQANEVRNNNIKTYAIGIGSRVMKAELDNIATTSDYAIQVADFSNLQTLTAKLRNDLCSGEVESIKPYTKTYTGLIDWLNNNQLFINHGSSWASSCSVLSKKKKLYPNTPPPKHV